ncbi:MAG: hypothetical protein COB34_01430 [Methylophilaceae bacterium]|nr:MAG: hypothetical protein COB34_01430 [Methylophilaceae bacterium]
MKSLIEKFFKRNKPNYNYVINEYKPNREWVSDRSPKTADYDIEPPMVKDEMEIDNIYQDS